MTHPDPERSGASEANRHADLEIKLAFLERELETWKEAVDALHARLERSEIELRNALRELRGGPVDDQPFGGGDSEAAS